MSELCKRFEEIAEECRFYKDGRRLINLQKLIDRAVEEGIYYKLDANDWEYIRQRGYVSAMEYSSALKRLHAKTPALASA